MERSIRKDKVEKILRNILKIKKENIDKLNIDYSLWNYSLSFSPNVFYDI